MRDKKKNGWIKFVPSLDLPKERVSIAYDTHDERGYRFAYGYFQFHNGTCGCFWKDGNEQPKVVKAEDIKYWMPVPSLNAQEEPVSKELEKAAEDYSNNLDNIYGSIGKQTRYAFKAGAQWREEQMMKNAVECEYFDGSLFCNDLREKYRDGDKVKIVIVKSK